MGEQLDAGAHVRVIEAFDSNQTNKIKLNVGVMGSVIKVDKDGDALIYFELGNASTKQWIFSKHFHKLRVDRKRKLEADKFVEGAQVVVLEPFMANQTKNCMELHAGLSGSVVKIDEVGDGQIAFDFESGIVKQWVFRRNFHKLQLQTKIDEPMQKRQRFTSWFMCRRRAAASGA